MIDKGGLNQHFSNYFIQRNLKIRKVPELWIKPIYTHLHSHHVQ